MTIPFLLWEVERTMNKNNTDKKGRKVYIRPEDVAEFILDLTEEWEKEPNPIDAMRTDLKLIIGFFKEEKFEKLQEKFRVPTLFQ